MSREEFSIHHRHHLAERVNYMEVTHHLTVIPESLPIDIVHTMMHNTKKKQHKKHKIIHKC